MAIVNQDFNTFAGDSVSPIFTVIDANNNAVDISGVTDIQWSAQLNLTSSAVITKTKSGGGITFVNTGTDGKFQVTLTTTDTSSLSGWYVHTAALLGAGSSKTTCTIGRMNVGQAPNWTYNAAQVGTVDLYTVRHLIGDVIVSDQQLNDQEILWTIGQYSNDWLAAAECCRNIAARYARQVDTVQAELRTLYSQRTKRYQSMAQDLEMRGMARGGVQAYVGGISISDKITNETDTDRVAPQFSIGMFDNWLPEAPVGHETQDGVGAAGDGGDGIVPNPGSVDALDDL
jgi:hypothetical protein